MALIFLKDIKDNQRVQAYLQQADQNLKALNYTEHGKRHALLVANDAQRILTKLNYDQRTAELAAIAGYLHDIGNMINRPFHEGYSALIAERILNELKMSYQEIAAIMGAIGNHDEGEGFPVSSLAAALIIADKSDVHRSRVRDKDHALFDIHDRVNYAVVEAELIINCQQKSINLQLEVDTTMIAVMDYFEIFLQRMTMCRRAARVLACSFYLTINQNRLI